MERTELMVGEGANRLRAGRLSRHRPDGESRRVPDDRSLWKGTALMRFAPFPTINSVLSNAAELRRQSRHVVGVRVENRPPMTRRDGRVGGWSGPLVRPSLLDPASLKPDSLDEDSQYSRRRRLVQLSLAQPRPREEDSTELGV
jgi:hypothetical protein